jgi:hypothetical protein
LFNLFCFTEANEASQCNPTTKTLLILDQSFYLRYRPHELPLIWQKIVRFTSSFINSFNLTYPEPLVVASTMCLYGSDEYYVDTLPLNCFEYSSDNLYWLLSQVASPSEQIDNKVILLTDANNATGDAITKIEEFKSKGIEIFCIGVGDVTNVGWLKSVVSEPAESHYMHVREYGLLDNLLPTLIGIVCNKSTTSGPYLWNQSGQFIYRMRCSISRILIKLIIQS